MCELLWEGLYTPLESGTMVTYGTNSHPIWAWCPPKCPGMNWDLLYRVFLGCMHAHSGCLVLFL